MKESRLCILFRITAERNHNELALKNINHWKSLAKKKPNKEVAFQFKVLEVQLLLGKKQGKNLRSFSKFITETSKSWSGNIWKDRWCLVKVVYIYAWHKHTYQWPDSFRKSSRIWHLKMFAIFSNLFISPFLLFFS